MLPSCLIGLSPSVDACFHLEVLIGDEAIRVMQVYNWSGSYIFGTKTVENWKGSEWNSIFVSHHLLQNLGSM